MPSQPTGEIPPLDGALPGGSAGAWGERDFGFYVHVPFCASRCGYCDFNTYTAPELAGSTGVDRATFAEHLAGEVGFARRVLGDRDVPVRTVFVGGGTPTLLAPDALGSVLRRIDAEFGLAPEAEVTLEANPDSVDMGSLARLREVGFTRISFGMQSAVPHVLAVLDRTHTPGGALRAVADARSAGFDQISLDLIYGTPGESLADWQSTVEAALSAQVGHISAYALIVEPGTRLAAAVRRGAIGAPDDDLMADMYDLADEAFSDAGLPWYELSNWAVPGQECRHNVAYWRGDDWWGVGPGSAQPREPAPAGGTSSTRRRTSSGCARGSPRRWGARFSTTTRGPWRRSCSASGWPTGCRWTASRRRSAARWRSSCPTGSGGVLRGRFRLTRPGRLLADAVVRRLVP